MFKNGFRNFKNFAFNKFSKKGFSSPQGTTSQSVMYGLLGLSSCGMAYLVYQNSKRESTYTKALVTSQSSYNSNIVMKRTKDTLVYFCSSIAITGGLTSLMARGSAAKYSMSPFAGLIAMIPTIYFMYKIKTSSDSNTLKPFYFVGFNACMAFSLLPIRMFIPLSILKDAGILTSGIFAGLGLVAISSKDDAFMNWSGALGAGLGGLFVLSFANIFLNSPIIFNIWLYGGLALFTAFTLYDIKKIQIKAQKQDNFNAMGESIEIYLDFIQIFIRLAMILNDRKKK